MKITHIFAPFLLLCAAMVLFAPAYAQDRSIEVDRIFNWVKPGEPG